MDKMKILLVGSSSLLGRTFCELFSNNYEIYSLSKSTTPYDTNPIECDLSEEIPFVKLPLHVDIIIYLAQANNYKDFKNFSKDIYTINTIRVFELIEYYKNKSLKKFIYASTGGVYTSSNEIYSEDDIISPEKLNDFYFKSKFSSELLLSSYSSFCNIIILRPFFMFGKNQKESMLFPRLIQAIKNKEAIKLNGTEGIKINPIYVIDAANILNLILNKNQAGIYNLAGNETISIKELCILIGEKLNTKPIFEYNDKSNNFIADISKFHYHEYTSIREAIDKVIHV